MNLLIPPPAIDPLYAFLPLALAGMVTFVLLSGQCLVQLFTEQDHSSM